MVAIQRELRGETRPSIHGDALPSRWSACRWNRHLLISLAQCSKRRVLQVDQLRPGVRVGCRRGRYGHCRRSNSKTPRGFGERRNHMVMARCDTIGRATTIHALYQRLAPEHAPKLVHSDDPPTPEDIANLRAEKSRIIVCVDMLGEGFDLPQLKIAAIHDTHKSLAVLLQFTGRFTRTAGNDIGDATVIANIADQRVSEALDRLYSEDADWNSLLSEFSSKATREHAAPRGIPRAIKKPLPT